jgi:hypothetical protein
MKQSIVTRAQKLYYEAGEIVAKEVKLKEQSGRHIVRLASILKDLYEIFQQRNHQHEPLMLVPKQKGFIDFRDCMIELLRPLDLHERTGWYYLSVGRHLLGKIPEAALAEMPFEKVKQLAWVAKSKTELPAALIERAKDPEEPAARLREEVDVMLFHSASDHSEGPKRSLVLVGGKKHIDAIEEKIDRLRPAVSEEGSSAPAADAEVVDFALADCLAGVQEAVVHEMGQSRHGRR